MMDDTYEVILKDEQLIFDELPDEDYWPEEESVYQGRLTDCEAYIRLKEGGYM